MDAVRRLVHDGKELTEICDTLMDICLAPDANSGGGIGCDNMTVMVVALLNGRTKEEWYAWVKDRVAHKYGYDTPEQLPQIYATSRLQAAQTRNNTSSANNEPNGTGLRIPAGGLGGLARALAGGGISFHPGSGVLSDAGTLMFEQGDSDEDESDDETGNSSTFFSSLRAPAPRDVTKSLKAQLDELRDGIDGADEDEARSLPRVDVDGDMEMSGPDDGDAGSNRTPRNFGALEAKNLRQGEAPKPPLDTRQEQERPQLKPQPSSGEAPSAAKVEGFVESSFMA